jgi:hypothetical protein
MWLIDHVLLDVDWIKTIDDIWERKQNESLEEQLTKRLRRNRRRYKVPILSTIIIGAVLTGAICLRPLLYCILQVLSQIAFVLKLLFIVFIA